MTRTHKWGSPAAVVSVRAPAEVAQKMDAEAEQYGVTRSDIVVWLLAQRYGYPLDSPFEPPADQLPLEPAGKKGRRKTPKTTRAA